MPFVFDLSIFELDDCVNCLKETLFPNESIESIALALFLKYNTNRALDKLLGGSDTAPVLFCVPDRMLPYVSCDRGKGTLYIHKAQYKLDMCALITKSPDFSREAIVEILNYDSFWEFDAGDRKTIDAVSEMVREIPGPRDLLVNYCLSGCSSEETFCRECYEVVEVDHIKEAELIIKYGRFGGD